MDQDNIIVSGYVFPALENAQISLSCVPGYSRPDEEATALTSTCTSEGIWYPHLSVLERLS